MLVSTFLFVLGLGASSADYPGSTKTAAPYINLVDNLDEARDVGWCLDLKGFRATQEFIDMQTHSCKDVGNDVNFFVGPGRRVYGAGAAADRCVTAREEKAGSAVDAPICDTSDPLQELLYCTDGTIRLGSSSLCLVAGVEIRDANKWEARDLTFEECDDWPEPLKTWAYLALLSTERVFGGDEECGGGGQNPTSSPRSSPVETPTRPPVEGPTSSDGYTKWRLWSQEQYLQKAAMWGLKELEFYRDSGCSGTNINTGVPIDSGHAKDTTGPEKAFDDDENTKWGGRYEEGTDEMWIGMEFENPEKFLCASFFDDNKKSKSTNFVKIQAYNDNSGTWIDMASADHEFGTKQKIEIKSGPGPAPTPTRPTAPTPRSSPVETPTRPPVEAPTSECVDGGGEYFYVRNEMGIFSTCRKLAQINKEQHKKAHCEFTESGVDDNGEIIGPAKEVCKVTCDTCGGGPGPAPTPTRPTAPTPTPPTASKAPNNLKEEYVRNKTGDISYSKMKNRNPDCSDYVGAYSAVVDDKQENIKLTMDFEISAEITKCVFTSNNIPNHDVGGETTNGKDFNDPVQPNMDDYVLNVPRNPTKTNNADYIEKIGGKMTLNGILLNGVDMDTDSAFCYKKSFITTRNPLGISLGQGDDKCGLNADWYAIPAANPENVVLDEFMGHSYGGRYHYHGDNEALSFLKAADLSNDYGSPVIGFAPDGFPIYGHFFYNMEERKVVMAESSWQLKTDFKNNGRKKPQGSVLEPPNTSTHKLGLFVEDYEYIAGSGDLDECNGMTDVFGNYGYYYTEGYPYALLCTFGAPDASFTKEGCEYNANNKPCKRSNFAFVEHGHNHGVEGRHEIDDHGVSSMLVATSAAQVLSSASVVAIVATGVAMLSVL